MFNQKFKIILFLVFHTVFGFKTNNFCFIQEQKCQVDSLKHQIIECSSMKCPNEFSHECTLNMCSNDISECNDYIRYEALIKKTPNNTAKFNNFKLVNKSIRQCKSKILSFKSNDLCVNGENCQIRIGSFKTDQKIGCVCPAKLRFKCDTYCSVELKVCGLLKSIIKNKNFNKNINNCGNSNTTYFRDSFTLF